MTDAYADPLYAGDVAVGDEGPTVVVEDLEPLDFVKYAGASGDFARFHVDADHARELGNPGVWGHGMLVGGYLSHVLSDWVGIANVTRYDVRFESRYWPGDTLTVEGTVTDVDDRGDHALVGVDLEATDQDGTVIASGSADATLPARDAGE